MEEPDLQRTEQTIQLIERKGRNVGEAESHLLKVLEPLSKTSSYVFKIQNL